MYKRYRVELGFGVAAGVVVAIICSFIWIGNRLDQQIKERMPTTLSAQDIAHKITTASHFEPSFSVAYFASEWVGEWKEPTVRFEWQSGKLYVYLQDVSQRRMGAIQASMRHRFSDLRVESQYSKKESILKISRKGT